jgi:crotonobetainyl-CoA:carnitine CoA-transferase CaiB-like acyl-CoA transferase
VPKSADRPRLAQAHILRTGDGGLIAIHLSSLEKFWTGLVAALDAPALTTDPRFSTRLSRIDNYDALGQELDRLFSRQPSEYWEKRLGANDVPYAPINRVDAAVKDPQVQHLGLMVPVQPTHQATHAVRPAVQFDGKRADAVRAAPLLNEHGEAIRAQLAASQAWPELT